MRAYGVNPSSPPPHAFSPGLGRRAYRFSLLLAMALAGLSGLLFASSIAVSLEQVTKRAEHIVVGKVEKIGAGYIRRWPGVGRITYSDVTITVAEEWKGQLRQQSLVLQVMGGRLPDGRRVVFPEAPRFKVGEKVLLFTKERRGRQAVFCLAQGKYTVIRERVVGRPGYPVDKDILTYPLKKRIAEILRKAR